MNQRKQIRRALSCLNAARAGLRDLGREQQWPQILRQIETAEELVKDLDCRGFDTATMIGSAARLYRDGAAFSGSAFEDTLHMSVCSCEALAQRHHVRFLEEVDEHLAFLEGTLIPDLRESGADATADDFETCTRMIHELKGGE